MQTIELIINNKDEWDINTSVELTSDNIEYLKSIPKYYDNIILTGYTDMLKFIVTSCHVIITSGGEKYKLSSKNFNEFCLYESDMSKCFLVNDICDNVEDPILTTLEKFRLTSTEEEKRQHLIEIEKECSHYTCKDEVIYRQKSNDNNFYWTYGIFSHYEGHGNNEVAVINGQHMYLCGYEILPYIGHEDMVGTNK